ncbi:MAG: hypothetical protein H0W53_03270 [Acidobacteria bacterium]|nr:hypothetical protein [Acidobacteriota bacterium]
MKIVLRALAIAIALAAAVDPALARRVTVPLPVDVLLPPASDPLFDRAVEVRAQLVAALGDRIDIDGREAPQAFVALGRTTLRAGVPAPVFAMPLEEAPAVVIARVTAPSTILGQTAPITATVRAFGLVGQTTTIALLRDGTKIESIEHRWTSDDETFVASQAFVPATPGTQGVRITATTDGVARTTSADVAVPVREHQLRVLAYEARPSWPLAFVRRSLEAEPVFDVTTTSRTTSRSATTSPTAPASLVTLQMDRFDAVLVGAPETLTAAEIRALDTFVTRRGGTLVLLPDRRLPENVIRAFGLPEFEEVILERSLTTAGPGPTIRTSELLLAADGARLEPLGAVRHAANDRVVVGSLVRGAGRIIVSGAMDAWRYRADPEVTFDNFWRGLIADAAAAAPPPVVVKVEPSIARAGDELIVSVTLRPTEFDVDNESISLPAVKAALNSARGGSEVIRLWPDVVPGTFEGRTRAPRAGTYTVSTSIAGGSADAPLLVADDVIHAASRSSRAAAFAAAATGGAVVTNLDDLAGRLESLEPNSVEQLTRPMRSPWWILPFTILLCAEWALRRKGGAR